MSFLASSADATRLAADTNALTVAQGKETTATALAIIQNASNFLKQRTGNYGIVAVGAFPGFAGSSADSKTWVGGWGSDAAKSDAASKWAQLKTLGIISNDDVGRVLATPTVGSGPSDPKVTTLLGVPTNAWLKQRFANLKWEGAPAGGQGRPGEEVVVTINLTTNETGVSYRWEGKFQFDTAEYEFSITATNGVRVTVKDTVVIESLSPTAQRTVSGKQVMTAGIHLVVVEWINPSGLGHIEYATLKTGDQVWVSCGDGKPHAGPTPSGWVQTPAGCWVPSNDLSQFVVIEGGPIQRAYSLKSGVALTSQMLQFHNTSPNISVRVQLDGPDAVSFAWQAFELAPGDTVRVEAVFDVSKLEGLPEGDNTAAIQVMLSTATISQPPSKPIIEPPVVMQPINEPFVALDPKLQPLPKPYIQPPVFGGGGSLFGHLITRLLK